MPSIKPRSGETAHLAFHYLEMVAAMAVGMMAYGALVWSPADPTGLGATLRDHPSVGELLMIVAMAVPMVAFMRYRHHSWRLIAEMTLGMALPGVAVVALAATSATPILTGKGLSLASHAAMLLGMLAAMLYRRREYGGSHLHHLSHAEKP